MEGEGIMRRLENWPILLAEFFERRKDMPFEWGVNDCMIFCSDGVLALTGTDPAADIRGTYSDQDGAAKVIAGFGDSVEAIIEAKGFKRVEKAFSHRGDVVTYQCGERVCGGIIDETARRGVFVLPNRGLTRIPLKHCSNVWTY